MSGFLPHQSTPRSGPARAASFRTGGTSAPSRAAAQRAFDASLFHTPIGTAKPLTDVWHSVAHTLIDLGDNVFTRGRPHPMLDHRLRNSDRDRGADPETAVLLLDVVLGYVRIRTRLPNGTSVAALSPAPRG